MGKKLLITPRSQIRAAIRRYIWLRSRERAAVLKRDNFTCQKCNTKQSRAKGKEFYVEVHHKNGIDNWDRVIDDIYEDILCNIENMETLCKKCHKNCVDKNEK